MARSRVDLPEPLLPISPIASPRYAVKLTPLTACTSRTPRASAARLTMRLQRGGGAALPAAAPLTR